MWLELWHSHTSHTLPCLHTEQSCFLLRSAMSNGHSLPALVSWSGTGYCTIPPLRELCWGEHRLAAKDVRLCDCDAV